jgi:hypothetical protein
MSHKGTENSESERERERERERETALVRTSSERRRIGEVGRVSLPELQKSVDFCL